MESSLNMKKNEDMHNYSGNLIRAIENPLPELKRTFKYELEFLKRNSDKNSIVLDVGCGVGRPTIQFAPYVKKIIGIDDDQNLINMAIKNSKMIKNIEFLNNDALNLNFPEESFDLTYCTYNLIGMLEGENRVPKHFEFRYLPSEFIFPSTTVVYEDKVLLIMWSKQPIAILIRGKEISDSYKQFFEILWKTGKK